MDKEDSILFTLFESPKQNNDLQKCFSDQDNIGTLTFQYINTNNEFKITNSKNTDLTQNVLLKIVINKEHDLSLLSIFLWKQKLKYFIQNISVTFLIVQHYRPLNKTQIPQLWTNLGGLSAHMGFEVQSVNNQSELIYKNNINVYHVSEYSSFDTSNIQKKNFQLSEEIQKDKILSMILVTKAALNCEKTQVHIIPIIFALNAIKLESQEEQLQESMFEDALNIYNKMFQKNITFQNIFHLPIHLIKVFKNQDKQNLSSKVEFQQMCDISYYNKVEFMCLARNFYREQNSVISFSSRSGKSTTMYSLYYYDLFSQKSRPVYLNLVEANDSQPLYYRTSFQFTSQNLYKLEMQPFDYFNFYYERLRWVLQQINRAAEWTDSCLETLFKNSQLELDIQKYTLNNLFDGLIQLQLCQQQSQYDPNVSYELIQFAKSWLHQQINYVEEQQEGQEEQKNVLKNMNLYVDECLSNQKDNDLLSIEIVIKKYEKFIGVLNHLISNTNILDEIFMLNIQDINSKSDDIFIKDKSINSWDKIFWYQQQNKDKLRVIRDKEEIIIFFSNQKQFIKEKATLEQKQYLVLNYWGIYQTEFNQYIAFIDQFIVESPQFPNIKKREYIIGYLFQIIMELDIKSFTQKLENILCQFFMQLYNPRGIETMFWRNIQYYICRNLKNFDFVLKKIENNLKEYFSLEVSLNDQTQIQKLNTNNIILVAGTDFSLINFVRQNQLCYNAVSSRTQQNYISTTIVSSAQPHPQILKEAYYKMQRVSIGDFQEIISQIQNSIQDLSMYQYYIHLMPEKSSEMQILCALISPQILFSDENAFLLNQSQEFKNTILGKEQSNFQMYQYKQIIKQLVFERVKNSKLMKIKQNQFEKFGFSIEQFHKYVVFISSTIYNKEILIIFNFQLTQHFFENMQLTQADLIKAQKVLSSGDLNEQNSVLIFALTLTGNSLAEVFIKMRNILKQSLYLQIFTLKNYCGDSCAEQIWDDMKFACNDYKFIFLQQSYDEFMHKDESQNTTKNTANKKLYFEQTYKYLVQSFTILLDNNQVAKQLVVISVIDKQKLKTEFKVSDYMLTIITDDSTLLDKNIFSFKSFDHYNINLKEKQVYYTFQILLEYGVHENTDLGRKLENSNIKSIMQLGLVETNILFNKQFEINDTMKKVLANYSTLIESDQQYELLDLQGQSVKESKVIEIDEDQIVYVEHQEIDYSCYQQFKTVEEFILFYQENRRYYNNNQKMQIIEDWRQNLSSYLHYIQQLQKIQFNQIRFQSIKTKLFENYQNVNDQIKFILSQNKDKTQFNFIKRNFLDKTKIAQSCQPSMQSLLQLLGDLVILEIQIYGDQITLDVVSYNDTLILEQNQRNIIGIEPVTKRKRTTDKLIENWVKKQLSNFNELYFKNFNSIQLTEEIAVYASLELFLNCTTVEEQIQHVIDRSKEEAQNGRIRINFSEMTQADTLAEPIISFNPTVDEVLNKFDNFVLIQFRVEKVGIVTITDLFCIKVE